MVHDSKLLKAVIATATSCALAITCVSSAVAVEEETVHALADYLLLGESEEELLTETDANADGMINVVDFALLKRTFITKPADPNEFTDFSSKWPDKFYNDDTVTSDDTTYKSRNVNMTITKDTDGTNVWYIMDIYLRSMESIHGAFANDTFGSGTAWPQDMAKTHNAICAINADFCGNRETGIIIRDGVLYRDVVKAETFAVYKDGTMKSFAKREFDSAKELENGVWQTYSFAPVLVKNSEIQTEFSGYVAGVHPRSGIGYFEPGHFCLILVDGRQDGYSVGVDLPEFAKIFSDLGCTEAFNLDGGRSSMMIYNNEVVNQPYSGGRKSSDIIYIAN